MNKLTTPMAILILGVLIFIALAFNGFSMYKVTRLSEYATLKTNNFTGYSCIVGISRDVAEFYNLDNCNK